MLLRSENTSLNALVLVVLMLSLVIGFLLLSAPSDLVNLPSTIEQVDEVLRIQGRTEDTQLPAPGEVSSQKKTLVPSGAPVVRPPTTTAPTSPAIRGQKQPRPPLSTVDPPYSLNATDPLVLNPLDKFGNSLPKCDDARFPKSSPWGTYTERGFSARVKDCGATLEDTPAEIHCSGLNNGMFAASYTPDGQTICRCGGIAMGSGICVLSLSMSFEYHENYIEDWTDLTNVCNESTSWENGLFSDGRYTAPNGCSILDLNPRSVVRRFPNKLFFFDGDSHQDDKIWGFVAEMRNQRLHAIPQHSDKYGKEIRYEVSEYADQLDLFYFRDIHFDKDLRKCRTVKQAGEPCSVFVYRFDRFPVDYHLSATDLMENPPDYMVAAFLSQTYSNGLDPQTETKAKWENVIEYIGQTKKSISISWTSFPMNSGFIIANMTHWIQGLGRFRNVRHHFVLLDEPFYRILRERSKQEPGYLTFHAYWHDSCQIAGKKTKYIGQFNTILASETCNLPVAKLLYRAMLSIFSLPR